MKTPNLALLVSLSLLCHHLGFAGTAASVSLADVQAAVIACPAGGTVIIPSGNATWNGGIRLSKAITIQGAGSDSTVITRHGSGEAFFQINSLPSDVLVRITGLNFDAGTIGQNGWLYSIYIENAYEAAFGYTKIRIDHCHFRGGQGVIFFKNWAQGLVDHCQFENPTYAGAMYSDGDADWKRPIHYGTREAVFWEDNSFVVNGQLSYLDCLFDQDMGSRAVFRHNVFDLSSFGADSFGSLITTHGNQAYWKEHDNWVRGTIQSEIYDNEFWVSACYRIIWPRGGRTLVANNKVSSNGSIGAFVAFSEEEGQSVYFSPVRTTWPAEDQVNNTFIWGNTINGKDLTSSAVYCWDEASTTFVRRDRDYWLKAPDAHTVTNYPHPGLPSKSNYPLTYNPPVTSWTPYTYPHPLIAETEGGHPQPTPTPSPTATPNPTPTPTPNPTSTPSPTPNPTPTPPQTWEHWIQQQNDWIREHPPTPD